MTHQHSIKSTGTAVIWHCGDIQHHDEDAKIALHHPIWAVIQTLRSRGCELTTVEQEHQAIQKIITQQPDFLLIHLQTAGNGGYNLCQKLRQQNATCHLPIVFIGQRSETSERIKVLRCGGNAYLQLPISPEECWLRLQQHLDTGQLVRQLQAESISLKRQVSEYSQVLEQQEQLKLSLAQENLALQRLAFVDGLTQVANRRSFNHTIVQRWQEAYKNQQPLSLLLCDIDYFKRYNDTYGHIEGDRCLRAVADALVRGTHREQDQVARYGGEEFAIILPDTQPSGAQKVALSVQSEIARAQIPHEGSLIKGQVSLSIGIFTLVPHSAQQPHEMLIHGADEALYTAKLWGRDRTVINTANGLASTSENYCLYDYTTDFKSDFKTLEQTISPSTQAQTNIETKAQTNTDINAETNATALKKFSLSTASSNAHELSQNELNQNGLSQKALPLPSLSTFLSAAAEHHPSTTQH